MTEANGDIDALLSEVEMLNAVGRFTEAIERCRLAASIAPEDLRPYRAWSSALYGAGQYFEAAQLAREAIRLDPDAAIGFRLESASLASLARQGSKGKRAHLGRDAVAAAREAVRLVPGDVDCLIALAQALTLTGEFKEADSVIQEAISLSPSSAATWVAASLIGLAAKHWQAAIDASQRALAIDPENYAALNNLGVALRASGKQREGTEALARAARLQPDARVVRTNLSRAGLNIIRVAILLILIPVGFFAHLGLGPYLVFAIASNIVLSKNPGLVLRLERWSAPLAVRFARRNRDPEQNGGWHLNTEFATSSERSWSAVEGRHRVRTPMLLVLAGATWVTALLLLVVTMATSQPVVLVLVIPVMIVAAWPTVVFIRRKRSKRAITDRARSIRRAG